MLRELLKFIAKYAIHIRPLLSKVSQDRVLQSFLKFMLEKLIWTLFTNKSIFSQLVYKFSSSFHRKETFKVFDPFFKLILSSYTSGSLVLKKSN